MTRIHTRTTATAVKQANEEVGHSVQMKDLTKTTAQKIPCKMRTIVKPKNKKLGLSVDLPNPGKDPCKVVLDQCPHPPAARPYLPSFGDRRGCLPPKKTTSRYWPRGSVASTSVVEMVKCFCFCLLLSWLSWLQVSNYQLSRDILQLKRMLHSSSSSSSGGGGGGPGPWAPVGQPSRLFDTDDDHRQIVMLDGHQGDDHPYPNGAQILHPPNNSAEDDDAHIKHFIYKHRTKKKRRKRKKRNETIKQIIQDSMKKNSYVLFLPGLNESTTQRGHFKWNLTFLGSSPDQIISSNPNGTFTFRRNGFFMVASQVNVKGINNHQNYGVSYGYKTVLVKDNLEDEDLMTSEITQDNRGVCYRNSDNLKRCASDSISHLVIRFFRESDRIAIKEYTNNYDVNYYLTPRNSYVAIIALNLWDNRP